MTEAPPAPPLDPAPTRTATPAPASNPALNPATPDSAAPATHAPATRPATRPATQGAPYLGVRLSLLALVVALSAALAFWWPALESIDAAVPLLSAAVLSAAAVWLTAGLAAYVDSRLRPDRFGHPRPIRRRGWIGLGALVAAGVLGWLTEVGGLYGFLPMGATAIGIWCLTGAARRAWLNRKGAPRSRREERIRLTRPGYVALVIAGVLLLGAFLGPSNMLLLVCCLVVSPLAADAWFGAGTLRRCEVGRNAPPIVAAGEVALIELQIGYAGRTLPALQVTATDRLRNRHEDLRASVTFTRVPPGYEQTGVYRLEPRTRGPHALGPITLSTAFPLGLVRREVVDRDLGNMLVLPALGVMAPDWNRRISHADELAHHARSRKGLFEDEFYQLREYRPGDAPRSIHWRSSARTGGLMVRENHESRDRDLVVLLDLHADGPPGLETENTEERAASLAATIVADHLRQFGGATLSLRTAGNGERAYLGRAGGDLTGPLVELALAEPGVVADPGKAAYAAEIEAGPAARRTVVTTREPDDPIFSESGFGHGAPGSGRWEIVSARPGRYEDTFTPPRFAAPLAPAADRRPGNAR